MKDKVISPFASREYHLLLWMFEHQTNTSQGPIVKFSQAELATECDTALATINKWIATLRTAKCIENPKRGNYRITDIGYQVISKMNEIENLVGGK